METLDELQKMLADIKAIQTKESASNQMLQALQAPIASIEKILRSINTALADQGEMMENRQDSLDGVIEAIRGIKMPEFSGLPEYKPEITFSPNITVPQAPAPAINFEAVMPQGPAPTVTVEGPKIGAAWKIEMSRVSGGQGFVGTITKTK